MMAVENLFHWCSHPLESIHSGQPELEKTNSLQRPIVGFFYLFSIHEMKNRICKNINKYNVFAKSTEGA